MAFDPTAEQIAEVSGGSRERIIVLAQTLTDEQATAPVPGTPLWTVTELMCHLVGSGIELAKGNFEGAGSAEWTQAQVEARRGRSVSDLLEEWDTEYAEVDRQIRAAAIPTPIAFDLITHEQDLRGAVGAAPLDDVQALDFIAEGFGARAVRAAEKAGLPALELRDEATGWSIGEPGGSCLSGSKFEIFRALTGRRSGTQVAAMSWTGDPTAYLDELSPFGPLRDTDVHD